MNTRQEYRKRAKEEKKVYFHFEMDRKYSTPKNDGGAWSIWSAIAPETADEIKEFFRELEKQGKI